MSQKLALIIGNSEYEDTKLAKLTAPNEDVNKLVAVLSDPNIGHFDDVQALVNQPYAIIQREIARFFQRRKLKDLLLLYFSGHGVRNDQGDLYLAVKDTECDLLSGTAISSHFINGEMDRSRSRSIVLMLDCCYSGAFARGSKGATGDSVSPVAIFEGTGHGNVVLTATSATQYAWEGDKIMGAAENSVFTHFLVQGLESGKADRNADGEVSLDELYDYVYEHVLAETSKQTPSRSVLGQQGEIVIAKNPNPIVKPVDLPAELLQELEDTRPAFAREAAVGELAKLLSGADKGLALTAFATLTQLANDDSRRVSAAVSKVLAQYDEGQLLSGREAAAGSKVTDAPASAPETEPTIDHTPQMVADPAPPGDDVEPDPSAFMSLSYYDQDMLEIIAPNGEIMFFNLDRNAGIINIGRHPENDVILDNPDVPLFLATLDHRQKPYQFELLDQAIMVTIGGDRVASEVWVTLNHLDIVEIAGYALIPLPTENQTPTFPVLPFPVQSPPLATGPEEFAMRPPDVWDDMIITEPSDREWTVDVEQTVTCDLTIINGGEIVATFEVSVEGLDPDWVTFSTPQINLYEGERATVTISMTPPRLAQSLAGAHHLAFVVTSPNYPGRMSRTGATLTVNPFYEYAVGELAPRVQTISWSRRYAEVLLPIINKGNAETMFRLEGEDTEQLCSFEFFLPGEIVGLVRQAEVPLPPDHTVSIPIRITPLLREFIGLRKHTYAFVITTSVQEGMQAQRSVLGQFSVKPLIGVWSILLSFIVLALFILRFWSLIVALMSGVL